MIEPPLAIQTRQQPCIDTAPPPEAAPARPEILHLDGSHLIWRVIQRPAPGAPRRPVTWDIRLTDGALVLKADLDRQGDLRAVDFREVRGRLNEVLVPEHGISRLLKNHSNRLRQSLFWQRNLDAMDPHIDPPEYSECEGWNFPNTRSCNDPIRGHPPDPPVPRPATDEIMAGRREERRWILYHARLRRWAANLGFDSGLPLRHHICRARIFQYWRIRECRELFSTAPSFAAVFGAPGIIPELDDPADGHWQETVARLARQPRREWMGHLGLPPTRQTARLFARLDPHLVVTDLPLIREVFADPVARQLLSDTTCRIPDYLLRYFLIQPPVLRWPLVRQLCHTPRLPHWVISSAMYQMDFIRNTPQIGPGLLKLYRRARNHEDVIGVSKTAIWLRRHWSALFEPGVRDVLECGGPPLAGTPSIRHINRPLELIQLSTEHNLCLGNFTDPIIRGEYALYRIDHQGRFAVAGIRRAENATWELDEIRGSGNADAPEEVRGHFLQWLEAFSDRNERPCSPPS